MKNSFRLLLSVWAITAVGSISAGYHIAYAGMAEGAQAYDRGDYSSAIKEWAPEAQKGDRNALFNLGQLYRMGKGVKKDPNKAEYYYVEAAKRGHSAAQGNLGTLYYFGKTGRPDVEKALQWWRLAAYNGDPRSQYMLGVLYYNGKHVKRDVVTAYAWMFLAANSGLTEAMEAEKKMSGFLAADELEAGKRLSATLIQGEPPVDLTELVGEGSERAAAAKESNDAMAAANAIPANNSARETAGNDASLQETVSSNTPKENKSYRIQLGAYRTRAEAAASWDSIQQRMPSLLAGLPSVITQADLGERGVFYRLQAGEFDTAAKASSFCETVKNAGHDCFPVKVY